MPVHICCCCVNWWPSEPCHCRVSDGYILVIQWALSLQSVPATSWWPREPYHCSQCRPYLGDPVILITAVSAGNILVIQGALSLQSVPATSWWPSEPCHCSQCRPHLADPVSLVTAVSAATSQNSIAATPSVFIHTPIICKIQQLLYRVCHWSWLNHVCMQLHACICSCHSCDIIVALGSIYCRPDVIYKICK